MKEKAFKFNGDVWTFRKSTGNQFALRCYATGNDPDFPISEIRFDMDQLMRNDNISENPPVNSKCGRKITMYHAKRGIDVLRLLAEIADSQRLEV